MPYPAQTDSVAIVHTARLLIEQNGIEQLSLAHLAATLGVKAPSLYRYVPSKAALIRAVNVLTIEQLLAAYEAALLTVGSDPQAQLRAMLQAHRAFAHANPKTYMLAFTTVDPAQRMEANIATRMVLPIQAIMAAITGEANSLAALRGALALAHGFVMLELNNQLQRGGDLAAAFDAAFHAYIIGWRQVAATAS